MTTINHIVADFLNEVNACDFKSLRSLRSVCSEGKNYSHDGMQELMTKFVQIIDIVGEIKHGTKWSSEVIERNFIN